MTIWSTSTAMFRSARRYFSSDAGPRLPALLLAVAPLDPGSLELVLAAARQPLPYLLVMPGEARAEVQVRGLDLDSVPLRAVAVVAPRGRYADCSAAAAPPVAFTVGGDAAQPLRRRFEPGELVDGDAAATTGGEGASGAAEEVTQAADSAEAAPLAASPPAASYAVALEDGWRLVVGQRVAVASVWSRLGASLRRGLGRLFGAPAPSCELQLAAAADDARRLQHLLRPGVQILVLPR